MQQLLHRLNTSATFVLLFEFLALVALGYAIGSKSIVVGAAIAAFVLIVLVLRYPLLALVPLTLLYVVPRSASLGEVRVRDLIGVCFAVLLLEWVRRTTFEKTSCAVVVIAFAFLTTVVVSSLRVVHEPGVTASLAELGTNLAVLMGAIYLGSARSPESTITVVRLLLVVVAIATLVGWWVAKSSSPGGSLYLLPAQEQAAFIFDNANFLGSFLAVGAVLTILHGWRQRRGTGWLLACATIVAAVAATGSRGAVLILAAGLLSSGLLSRRRIALVALALLITPLAVVAVRGLTNARIEGSRSGGISTESIQSSPYIRSEAARLAVTLIKEHPLTGVGYGRFPAIASGSPRLGVALNTHNDVLRIGAESGLVALTLLLSLLVVLILAAAKAARRFASASRFAAFCAVCAYAVSLLVTNGLASVQYSGPWLLLAGVLVGCAEVESTDAEACKQDHR